MAKLRSSKTITLFAVFILLAATAGGILHFCFGGDKPYVADITIIDVSQEARLNLEDGATVIIPPGALPEGATVTISKLDISEVPESDEDFAPTEFMYHISSSHTLAEPITLHFPTPEVGEEELFQLSHYHEGKWEPVPFVLEDGIVVVQTDTLSVWGWMRATSQKVRDTYIAMVNPETYIQFCREFLGYTDYVSLPLAYTAEGFEYYVSCASLVWFDDPIISASVEPVGDMVSIRVRNNTKFHLQISFDYPGTVTPQRGAYLDYQTVHDTFIVMNILSPPVIPPMPQPRGLPRIGLPQGDVILLPEGTAEFAVHFEPSARLVIRGKFSTSAKLFTIMSPLFGVVPVMDLEVVTALRDGDVAYGDFIRMLPFLEQGWLNNNAELQNLKREIAGLGLMVGEKAFATIVTAVFPPSVTLESTERSKDILKRGGAAEAGAAIYIDFPEDLWTDVGAGDHNRGNTTGNIINGGLVAYDGNWVYYERAPHLNIARMRPDGTGQEVLTNQPGRYLNVYDGWVYYSARRSSGIYRMRTDGSENEQMSEHHATFMTVTGGWVYYINRSDGNTIYRMPVDGSAPQQLNQDSSTDLNVIDGWLYYINEDDDKSIYRMRVDGNYREKLNDSSVYGLIVVENTVYYVIDSGMWSMRTDGSNPQQKIDVCASHFVAFNLCDEWIYISFSNWTGFGAQVYRTGRYNANLEEIFSDNTNQPRHLHLAAGKIYYEVVWGGLHRMNQDGSEKERVSSLDKE